MSLRGLGGIGRIALLILVVGVGQAWGTGVASQESAAAQKPVVAVDGYVSATHFPDGFDVNAESVLVEPSTSYQWHGSGDANNRPAASDDVKPGVYVEVTGTRGEHGLEAVTVTLRESPAKTIKGFGLIVRVIAAGAEPVYEADGYRIRVLAGTTTKFSGALKTLADVGPNVWVKYEGKRDTTGDLVATDLTFFPAKFSWVKTFTDSEAYGPYPHSTKLAARQSETLTDDKLINANGDLVKVHTKVRLSDAGGWCGWHKVPADQALQARVLRVGMSVVPAYQKQLKANDPWKIPFRFYAVDDSEDRFAPACNEGLILVPRQLVARLRSDDQLAAVLAQSVAYNLLRQSAKLNAGDKLMLGADIASILAADSVVLLASDEVAAYGVTHGMIASLNEECGRIALGLMADAGYDPWQAPEAWRLLAPKKLPADTDHLRYSNLGGYQLAILNLQYPHNDTAKPAPSGRKADAPLMK